MSNFSNILRLFPTLSENHKEVLNPDVLFPCPFCSGNGWHWANLEGESYKKPCSHCNGTGKLKANITIQWSPSVDPNS